MGRKVALDLAPLLGAVGGVEGDEVDAFGREHSRGGEDGAVLDDERGADGPDGNESAVAGDTAVDGCGARLPGEFAGGGVDAVDASVVGAEVGAAVDDGGGETDGAFGVEGPDRGPGTGVEAADGVVGGGAEVGAVGGDDDVEGAVEELARLQVVDLVPAVPFGLTLPGGLGRVGGLPGPGFGEGFGEWIGGNAAAGVVASVGGPVRGLGRGGAQGEGEEGGEEGGDPPPDVGGYREWREGGDPPPDVGGYGG